MSRSKYDPAHCAKLIELMSAGYSFDACAGYFKTSRKTLYNWCDSHTEFSEAKELATAAGNYFWETQLIEGIWKTKEFDEKGRITSIKDCNNALLIFTLKNRFGWRDRHDVVNHNDDITNSKIDTEVVEKYAREY